jgi:phage/plasmid primase-like uncharacterized protein
LVRYIGPFDEKMATACRCAKVIIFGDNDKNFTGQEAAYSLARSLSGDLEVDIKIPTLPGTDWNDVHRDIMSKA